ncbi:Endonuclease/exonuclease/phosphatase, partial [Mycena olivaceomarginata]
PTATHALGPTYKPTKKTPAPPKPVTNPLSAHHPSRLIVQILPGGLKPEERPDAEKLTNHINDRLAADPQASHLKVVSHKWTYNGHCVVLTRADQSAAELIKFQHLFTDAIAPGHQTKAGLDIPWVKIKIDGIRTGAYDRVPTIHSEEALHRELSDKNPIYNELKIVQAPRWMRSKEEVASIAHSSIVFAVEDSEQAQHLLREVKKRADFTVTLRSDIAKDLDLQVIEVAQQGAPTTTFVNAYNDTTQRRSAVERLRDLALPANTPVIYLGDFNLHHELWSCTDKSSNSHSRRFLEWMTEDEHGPQATLLNEKGKITYTPHAREGVSSVIDLTFANGTAIMHDTIQEWVIDRSMSYGSDHHGIRWVMNYGRREVENATATQYSLKEVDPEDWRSVFRNALGRARPEITPIMDEFAAVSDAQLDTAANALTTAMSTATAEIGKI